MNAEHLKTLFISMNMAAPHTTQAHHKLHAHLASTGGNIFIGQPDNPDTATIAWAIFSVPYFSAMVLNEADLNQFVVLAERAQAAFQTSKGVSRFSKIITDHVIGL